MFFKKYGKDYIRHLFNIPEFHVNPSSVPKPLYRRGKIIDRSLSRSSSTWSTESFVVTPSERVSRHVWNSLNALSIYQTYPRWFFSKNSWKSSLFHCQEMTGPPLSGRVVLTFGKRPEKQFLQSVVVYAFLPWRMLWWKKTFRDWEVPKT